MSETGGDGAARGESVSTAATVVDVPSGERAPGELSRGDSLGRYVVIDTLGRGGMGLVYKAYDPELDRRIAVKLVRVKRSRKRLTAQKRLVREAQALAQLSHPNVIGVYDVGTYRDDVFIAMELVEGQTMRQWLRAQTPSQSEVIRVMVAAGRGLDAAHRAGLVHRDFKPDNVVIGDDGRPRVIDFGLARAAVGDAEAPDDDVSTDSGSGEDDSGSRGRRHLDTPLTRAGSVLGTPAYMAPEQHLGAEVDARSDQFSFCVTLYRGLYGRRPFSGDDADELADRITHGRIDDPPRRPHVAPRLRSILMRGLSTEPDQRFPDMAALLSELDRDPAKRRSGAVAVVAAAFGLGLIAFALAGDDTVERRCRAGPGKVASVWNDTVRSSLRTAFESTGRPHAIDTIRRVDVALSAYGDDWARTYADVCEATHVRGEQSERLLDLRMSCLTRRLDKMGALIDVLSGADDAALVDRAVTAVSGLSDFEGCSDERRLEMAVPPPDDPEARLALAAGRQALDRAEALGIAGDYAGAFELASQVSSAAQGLGFAPLEADALYIVAANHRRLGRPDDAQSTLHMAAMRAAEARDDDLSAEIWIEMMWVVGYAKNQPDRGIELLRVAEPAVVRSGSVERRGDLANNYGAILRRKGKLPEARKSLREALDTWTEAYGADHLQVAKAHNNLGNVLNDMGKYDQAREHHLRVLDIRRDKLGVDHPLVASSLNNLGNSLLEQGKPDRARNYYEQSLDIASRLDPQSEDVVMALNNLGNALADLGELPAAREKQQQAIDIQKKRVGENDPSLGISINNLADVLLREESYDAALVRYEQARNIWIASLGADHTYVAHATAGIGHALLGKDQFALARAEFEAALAIWKEVHAGDHPTIAVALAGLARGELGLGRAGRAVELLERALSIREAGGGDPLAVEVARFELATALWQANRDRPGAVRMAEAARDAFSRHGVRARRQLAEVDGWLADKSGN